MSTAGTGYTTSSLLGYIATYTSGAGTNLITTEYSSANPAGVTTTCGVQTGEIQTSFTNYTNNDLGPQVAGALGMTYATFASQYGLVNSSIYNMSSSAASEIEQMTAVNQYDAALIASANLAGVNPTQLAYGSALAQQNMNDSFAISGQLAGEYMPVVYGIFSALFLAFSLFLIILMALPIGVNYLKMYMELGLFLAVWPALMAVYNYVMDLIVQHGYAYLAMQGYSLNSAHSVNTYISSQLGWMGYLSWGVPMMAYALVTGSTYAMVGAISSMDSAGRGAASAGAGAAASGNVNLGNDSLNNYNANKANSAVQDVAGQMRREQKSGNLTSWQSPGGNYGQTWSDSAGVTTSSYDGKLTGNQDSAIPASLTQSIQGQATSGYNTAKANAESSTQQLQSANGKTLTAEWGLGNKVDGSIGKTFQSVATNQFQTALSNAASKTGKTEQQTFDEIKAQGGLGISMPLLDQLGANLGLETNASAGAKSTWSSSQQQELKSSFNNSLSHQIGATNDIKYSGSGSEFDNLKNARSDQLTAMKNYNTSQSKLKQATTGLQTVKSYGATIPEAALLKYSQYRGFDAGQSGRFDERFNAGDKESVAGFHGLGK